MPLRRALAARTVERMKNSNPILPDTAILTIPGIRELVTEYRALSSAERIELLQDVEHSVILPVAVKRSRARDAAKKRHPSTRSAKR